ncbi:MAG: ATP-binding cassette domain-containing protein, partial [Desulfobacterales bacterium]|nr:ATP-binding cassette domain-containing protein [Desulfobacterales bacterium]
KTPLASIKKRVLDAARILHIEELLERKPSELSGGQRQRVAMGRAIVRNPSVFLFDEPLSNLDAKLRTRMRIEIKQLHQRLKSTIIYVTHDQVEAMTLGDRIVVLRDGKIEQVGGPMELFQNPDNTFVAGFIGSPPMNLIDAEIVEKEGLTLQFPGGLRLPIPEKPGAEIRPGQKVVMGLRTGDLSLDDDAARFPAEWVARGVVEVVEPLGGEAHVHANIQGVKAVAQCEGRRSVHPGDEIRLALNLAHLHIFDAATRKSIY